MSWFSIQPPSSSTTPASGDQSNRSVHSLGPGSLHPVSSRYSADGLFGALQVEDTAWLAQTSGFVTETQTFYLTLPGGKLVMCQVIHSAVGLWYPQIQFTFRFYDPNSKTHIWKSTNVTNFKTPPNSSSKYDKRSCQADQFSILLDPSKPDQYLITGQHDDSVQLKITIARMRDVPGWKIGQDSRGGFTYFGQQSHQTRKDKSSNHGYKPDLSAGSDGYLVHRFWPRCSVSGHLVLSGETIELGHSRAIFIHAVQGMRPNLIASRWNFCNFQSIPSQNQEGVEEDPGVSLILMEFTSVPGSYGPAQVVSVGSVVVGDKLVAVTCGPSTNEGVQAKTTHQTPLFLDPDTNYHAPSSIRFQWGGPLINLPAQSSGGSNQATAEIVLDLGAEERSSSNTYITKGLIGKIDVMAEIPYLIKKVVAAVVGARPFIYTWMNPVSASISLPKGHIPSSLIKEEPDDNYSVKVEGYIFNEATFISD